MEIVNSCHGCVCNLVKVLAGSYSEGTLDKSGTVAVINFGYSCKAPIMRLLMCLFFIRAMYESVFTLHHACPRSSELVGKCIVTV